MDPATFVAKWSRAELSERAASQEHFLDLCRLLGQPTPAEHDATGAEYTFEKGVRATGDGGGDRGFADVWWRGKFAWEYKRKGGHKTLDAAYAQLQRYREALANPPLIIVSDIARTEIHTNFTGFSPVVHTVELARLHEPEQLDILRRVFTRPESFRPELTAAKVTEQVAHEIGAVAQALRARGHDPHAAAHFLMKVMFCLFAEDVDLLPRELFKKLLLQSQRDPARLRRQMDQLFDAMRTGGDFGVDPIAHFNGGLFDRSGAIELTDDEIAILIRAAIHDWAAVEPSVFGTLFERSLDPAKRSQIGAHYTSRDDIMLVIEPVIVRPLRREWDQTRAAIEEQIERRRAVTTRATKADADRKIDELLRAFLHRLASVRVLDPACGSGNFLYVAIQQLLALEKEVILYASRPEIGGGLIPRVRPTQLHGIEINPYAAELAQVVIWIGYLQWMRDNGFNPPRDPILEPIATIENRDAILAWEDEQGQPIPVWREGAACRGQAKWPEADFIVGNPPFLGSKVFRQNGLPDPYVEQMYANFQLPNTVDLCCYWFDVAAKHIAKNNSLRIGLLATQAIRGGDNRTVLTNLSLVGQIFDAWPDKPWVLDGAAVRVSIVCASGHGASEPSFLNGLSVPAIAPELTAGVSLGNAQELDENQRLCWMGVTKGGSFDVPLAEARELLAAPSANGRKPSEVVFPWYNGLDITRRPRSMWLITFPESMPQAVAAGFDSAFRLVEERVKPERSTNRRALYAERWWIHAEARSGLHEALKERGRYLATPRVTKHRLFAWLSGDILPDCQVFAWERSDDYFFGVLHSSIHELWALRQGTQLESRPRYTPTTCFETFPLPWPPGHEPAEGDPLRPLHDAIAAAAKALNDQRERWLNPPEWIAEVAAEVDAKDDFADVARVSGPEAQRLIRQSAIDAAAAKHPKLKKRTLTNLYNERPTWLRLAHLALDRAVLAAYAATDAQGGWDPSWAEVFEPTGAGQPLPADSALTEHRAEVEQSILAALLRLNHERAGG